MNQKSNHSKEVSLFILTCFLAGSFTAVVATGAIGQNAIVLNIGTSQLTNPFQFNSNILEDVTSGELSSPQLLIDNNNFGHMVWMENNSAYDYTIRYTMTTSSIDSIGGWEDWNATTIDLPHVNQSVGPSNQIDNLGICKAAFDSFWNVIVLFSNSTSVPVDGTWDVDINLWNTSSDIVTPIWSGSTNWTALFQVSASYARGVFGKLLFDASGDPHVAWNNGTHLMYDYNSSGVEIIAGANGELMSEFDMLMKSNGDINFVYSMGADLGGKEIYTISGTTSSWGSETLVDTANAIEDTRPSAAFDASENLIVTWSRFVDNSTHGYIIMYKNMTSGTTSEISTDNGALITDGIKDTSFNSKIIFYLGRLNIIYTDASNVSGSGDDLDIVWRQYSNPSNLASFSYTVLSADTTWDIFHEAAVTSIDDLLICWAGSDERFRMVKIDQRSPTTQLISPAGIINNAEPVDMVLPTSFNITCSVNEGDVNVVIQWDGGIVSSSNIGGYSWIANIPSSSITRGTHVFTISAVDEAGNSASLFTGNLTFSALNFGLILTLILSLAIGVPVALILFVLYKNRAKLEKKKLKDFHLGGKKAVSETWDDDAPIEEEESNVDLDDATKMDLKKVDMG